MAKQVKAKKLTPEPLHSLELDLFAPGMTAMHRAGLGGLACTLKALERNYFDDPDSAERLPALPINGKLPWTVTDRSVTLHFPKPQLASTYLQRLFEFAFSIRSDGLIFLPGQFEGSQVSAAVLADLQSGLTLTFLQHGKVRTLDSNESQLHFDSDDENSTPLQVNYKRCSGFKHQEGWKSLVDTKECVNRKPVRIDGPMSPGSVIRHVAFTGDTGLSQTVELVLPLYFAMVGCICLPVNRGVGVIVIPDVSNLIDFQFDRPAMTPRSWRDSQIANAADAMFRAYSNLRGAQTLEIRNRVHHLNNDNLGASICAMTLQATPWASQQKSRVGTISVSTRDDKAFRQYEQALLHLPPRIRSIQADKKPTRKGKKAPSDEATRVFRVDSVLRPLIAQNLALGRRWYAGYWNLETKINPANGKPFRESLSYERKDIHAMINDPKMWDTEGESLLVQAVHEAIRKSFGRIRDETDKMSSGPPSVATKNRWNRFRERLRLDLVGAKTESQLRFVLTSLFGRGMSIRVLQDSWQHVLPVIRKDWQLARDLGLLALASYAGKSDETDSEESSQPTP